MKQSYLYNELAAARTRSRPRAGGSASQQPGPCRPRDDRPEADHKPYRSLDLSAPPLGIGTSEFGRVARRDAFDLMYAATKYELSDALSRTPTRTGSRWTLVAPKAATQTDEF